MKIAYINCSSGVSGDMLLSALISAGLPEKYLNNEFLRLYRFGIRKPYFSAKRIEKEHLPCVSVDIPDDFNFKSPAHLKKVIASSNYSDSVIKNALEIIAQLTQSEAAAHNIARNKVHFHELNSKDTLIDVLGVSLGFEYFGVEKILISPVNVGKLNPAAAHILKSKKIIVYSDNSEFELTTPTGAAIISTLSSVCGNLPLMNIEASGFGAGKTELKGKDNILRLFIGHALKSEEDEVLELAANIDDMNPQIYPHVMHKLFAAGALDVWLENITMKQGRPAVKLSVLCNENDFRKMSDLILYETTTAGIRYSKMSRRVLKRKQFISKKEFYLPNGVVKSKVEYKYAQKKANKSTIPIKEILK